MGPEEGGGGLMFFGVCTGLNFQKEQRTRERGRSTGSSLVLSLEFSFLSRSFVSVYPED